MFKPSNVREGCCCSSTSTTIVGAGRDGGSCLRRGKVGEAAGRVSEPETDVHSGRASSGARRSVGRSLRRSLSAGAQKPGNTTSRSGTSQVLHGRWGPTRRAVGTDLLPLSGKLEEVPPNPTWMEVLGNPLLQSQYDWFAGRMIPIHPAQTTCRDTGEFPNFLKPTTHMVLTSLSQFLQTTTTFDGVHGGVENARQTNRSEPNCVLSVQPMPHIACLPNMGG